MRTVGRTDSNQRAIVKALRDAGASVFSLANMGKGCPDLLVSRRKVTMLLEVKDGSLPPSKRKLTPDEMYFHNTWPGLIFVVESVEEAIKTLELYA